MVSDNGILSCLDLRTGSVNWRIRLKGEFASSIVFGDDKLYVSNNRGETTVLQPSPMECKILSVNQLDSNIQSTLALHNRFIYARTQKMLYKLGSK